MPVVPEVWVIRAGCSAGMVIAGTRGAPPSEPSSVAPSWLPEVSSTFSARSKTEPGSPASFAPSVIRYGRSVRRTSSATVAPSRLGDSSTGTAPIRDAAKASRVMSKPFDLWITTRSAGRTRAAQSRAA
jgi:hypothetical protein